jgi:hypothetical protein
VDTEAAARTRSTARRRWDSMCGATKRASSSARATVAQGRDCVARLRVQVVEELETVEPTT